MDKLLTPKDAAPLMGGVSTNTLAFWRHVGEGPKWAKLGRRVVYRESDVKAWIDEQFEKAAKESA